MSEWLVPVLVGLIGLGGVLVGQRGSSKLERQRWDREHTTRWHTERYVAYSSLMSAVVLWHRALSTKATPSPETAKDLMAAIDAVREAQGPVEIVGSDEVRRALDYLWRLYGPLTVLYAEGKEMHDELAGTKSVKEVIGDARDLLVSEMRRDLDVPDRKPLIVAPTRWQKARRGTQLWTTPSYIRLRWALFRHQRSDPDPSASHGKRQ